MPEATSITPPTATTELTTEQQRAFYRASIREKIFETTTGALPDLTARDAWLPTFPPHLKKACAVIGMRRAGKTSVLWQEIAKRHAAGTPRSGLLYFNFEDERLSGMRASDLTLVLEEYYQLYPEWRDPKNTARATFFLDEIQLVSGWEGFARRILDSENVDLFISGSSARMLSREIATAMRGRALETVVTPFSFREYLRHAGREPNLRAPMLTKHERSRYGKDLMDYLLVGGFPEAQGMDKHLHSLLLRSYIDVVLLRDVIERYRIAQPQVLRWMVQQLLSNAAGSFSINKFYQDLKSRGVSTTKEYLYDYLGHLEDAFLVQTVSIATDSERRRQVNPRKCYPADTGLMSLYALNGRANTGHALETVVLHELQRRGAQLQYIITKDGYEVDFLASFTTGEQALVQVCADLDNAQTLRREVRALESAAAEFPHAARWLIALNAPPSVASGVPIECLNALEWLLGMA